MISEVFENQLMQAIVRQFFENPPVIGNMPDGQNVYIPGRPTPVQAVAARLLADKNGQLLDAIMASIDMDLLATDVAAHVVKHLTVTQSTGFYKEPIPAVQKALREQVDKRLVELLAQDQYAKMKAADVSGNQET